MDYIPPVIFVPGITGTYLRDEYQLPPDRVWGVIEHNFGRVALHPDDPRFEAVEPARDSVVVFTDDHRTVSLPMRAALPVLTRAHRRDDAHPSVALLAGAALLAMRLVAAGRLEPDQRSGWRIAELGPDDQDRLDRLVAARAPDPVEQDWPEPEALVRRVMDAVADAMPRNASSAATVARPPRPATRRT